MSEQKLSEELKNIAGWALRGSHADKLLAAAARVEELEAALSLSVRLLNQDIPDEEQAVYFTEEMLVDLANFDVAEEATDE